VIFVGRICYQKNVEVFLDVVRRFRGDKNIHFTLVGAGHYAGDKEYLERSLGAGELDEGLLSLIDWMPRDQLLDLYAQADVCILTSRYESFGYVVAEANAVGTPAVVSGVDGVRDIVLDGVSGYINPDSSAESFYDALEKLRDNPELLAEMGRHAHARVLERFNIEKNARMLAEFYDKQLLLAR